MRTPARKFTSTTASQANLNGVTAGSDGAGAAIKTQVVYPGTLSALYVVDAETNTLTITAVWQVSDDASTWYDLATSNNAANVALATGTSGADPVVSRAIPCPAEAYGWRNVRAVARVGVTTGTSSDLYTITYRYLAS